MSGRDVFWVVIALVVILILLRVFAVI